METLLSLAHGEKEVMEFGAGEWFESFFDHFPYEGAANQDNTAITESEWLALAPVLEAMQRACETTPSKIAEQDLIATGWPARVAPMAKQALEVFRRRGRFSEEVEEDVPSSKVRWP